MKDRDRYLKIVEWSEEDNCYVGSVPGWIGPCCQGDNEEKVYHQLCCIVDEWTEIYKKDGMPLPPGTADKNYSGKFQLRTGSALHKALAIKALQSGESLNNFCISVLRKSVTTSDNSRDYTVAGKRLAGTAHVSAHETRVPAKVSWQDKGAHFID